MIGREIADPTPLAYDLVTTQAELDALAGEWDELVRAMPRPSPFMLHAWVTSWWRHYGGDLQLRVHVVRRGERLVGALPLQVGRASGLRVAAFLGGTLTNFADALVEPGEDGVTDRLASAALRSGQDYARLHGLDAGARIARALGPRLELVERVEAPVLDLSAGWDAVYASRVSSKRRAQHRRSRRRLAERGALDIRVARSPEEIDAVLDDTFRVHELRWAGEYDGSGYATPAGRSFHRDVLRRLAEQDLYRIVTLELDGTPIAFHSAFALCGRLYVHRIGFDPAFRDCTPGVLNTNDALEAAAAEGLTLVEFMGGADEAKLSLADGIRPMYDGFGLAASPQGRAAAALMARGLRLRKRLKRDRRLRSAYLRARSLASRLAPS
jgi:CelD/BcsL family acetyltransferase involved in cellulose biosynthesis